MFEVCENLELFAMPSVFENYGLLEIVGYGLHSIVYKARRLHSQQVVALKKIRSSQLRSRGFSKTVSAELSAYREIPRHDNILEMYEFVEDRERAEVCFVLEYMKSDLRRQIDATADMPTDVHRVKYIVYQILCGLQHCHAHHIVHRDLKPHNLLLDPDTCALKISDFSYSRNFYDDPPIVRPLTPGVPTPMWYRAPELLLHSEYYNSQVDIWAAGCIFAEFFMGQPLFKGNTEIEQITFIFRVMGTPTEQTWPGILSMRHFMSLFPVWNPRNLSDFIFGLEPKGLDLLRRMLTLNPERRITAAEAIKHDYFEDFHPLPELHYNIPSPPQEDEYLPDA